MKMQKKILLTGESDSKGKRKDRVGDAVEQYSYIEGINKYEE